MKVEWSSKFHFRFRKIIKTKQKFCPAFPLPCSSVCIQSSGRFIRLGGNPSISHGRPQLQIQEMDFAPLENQDFAPTEHMNSRCKAEIWSLVYFRNDRNQLHLFLEMILAELDGLSALEWVLRWRTHQMMCNFSSMTSLPPKACPSSGCMQKVLLIQARVGSS